MQEQRLILLNQFRQVHDGMIKLITFALMFFPLAFAGSPQEIYRFMMTGKATKMVDGFRDSFTVGMLTPKAMTNLKKGRGNNE